MNVQEQRSLGMLLRIKTRRAKNAEQAWKESQDRLGQAQAACDRAARREAACVAAEDQRRQEIRALLDGREGFLPDRRVLLERILENQQIETRLAKEESCQARQQVDQAQQALRLARQQLDRINQHRDHLRERLAQLRLLLDRLAEDAQDEESEEFAAARVGAGDAAS